MEIFCSNINVFTVTSDKLNASLLEKSINLLKKTNKKMKILQIPNLWMSVYFVIF